METFRLLFRPYPGTTADLPRPQAGKYSPRSNDWIVGFYGELFQPATDALDPIIVPTTRGAGITAAADTRLALPLFTRLVRPGKSHPQRTALGMTLSRFRALQRFRACCAP
jgi:hypothetical protein